MGRILCVHFPHWPLQRLRAVQPELEQGGVVFHTPGPPARARLVHCSRKALEARLAPGMPLGEGLALAADLACGIRFLPLEPAADRAMLEVLALQAVRFAPRIGLDDSCRPLPEGCAPSPADSLLCEIDGCAALWGGEAAYLAEIHDYFRLQGWRTRLAAADAPGAAWAAARHPAGGGPLRIVPPGAAAQRAALRAAPLAALRLPAALLETLAALGWNVVGDLEAVERAAWPARFGAALGVRWDQAHGAAAEWFRPVEAPSRDEIRCRWEHPVEQTLVLRSWLEQLLQSLIPRLAARGEGVLRLACRLELEDGAEAELELRLLQPRRRPSYLAELLHWEWERRLREAPLSAGVVGCALEAVAAAPLPLRQRKLWSAPPRGAEEDDADRPLDEEQRQSLAQLVERLTSRLGEDAAQRIVPAADVDPAAAFRLEPWRPAPSERSSPRRKPPPNAPVFNPPPTRAENPRLNDDDVLPNPAKEAAGPRGRSRRRSAKRPPVKRGPPPPPTSFSTAPRPLRLASAPIPLAVESAEEAGRLVPTRRRPPADDASPAAPPERFEWDAPAAEAGGAEAARLGPAVRRSRAEVVRWWGPERLEGGWSEGAPFARDYYQVETSRGERLWIFHSRPDDRWFLHGWFA